MNNRRGLCGFDAPFVPLSFLAAAVDFVNAAP